MLCKLEAVSTGFLCETQCDLSFGCELYFFFPDHMNEETMAVQTKVCLYSAGSWQITKPTVSNVSMT